jgi:hypothetical protein
MNRKQFIILLVLVVVVGAAGWIVRKNHQESWQSSGQTSGKLLPNFPINDVAQVTIQSGTNTLHLVRRDNLWRVQERADYPANFSQISDLLIKLGDLKISQSQDVWPSQLGRFELLPPGAGADTGALLQFSDQNGKPINSVLLGKKHLKKPAANAQAGGMPDESWPDGRYVMVGAYSKTLIVISDPLETVDPKPDAWLNKDFIKIEKPAAISLDYPVSTNSWKLTHESETNDWTLADAKPSEKLDSSKVSSLTGAFSSISFNDVLPPDTKPEISGLTNVTTLTVGTADHFTYTAKIGPAQDDVYPITVAVTADLPTARAAAKDEKPDDKTRLDKAFADQQKTLADKLAREKQFAGWIFKVPSYSLSSILKTRPQLFVEPKAAESSPAQPAALSQPEAAAKE